MIYRFDDIVGNSSNIQLIKRSLDNGSYPQVSIMGGVMGTGKSSTAKAVALALTCDTVRDHSYDPCCSCIGCKNAIVSFASTGKSSYIKIFNAAQMTKIEDVKEMIDQIFVRDNGLHKNVYIIEEAHVLSSISNAQTILLDELDRMQSNTYLIMTTTNVNKIIKTIRSRAITFNFHRLNMTESRVFINRLCDKHGYSFKASTADACTKTEIVDLIAQAAQGIPRNIEKALEFICSTNPTREELYDFFQQISDNEFLNLLLSASQADPVLYSNNLDSLCNSYEAGIVIRSFKDFVARKYFEVMGDAVHSKIFAETEWNDIIKFASSLEEDCTESDLRIKFLQLRLRLRKATPASLVENNARVGQKEKTVAASERRKSEVFTARETLGRGNDVLTARDLQDLARGNNS